jgi:hypothetical protein
VTNLLPYQESHEPNSSAVLAIFRVLRRQPWDLWASKMLAMMKSMLQSTLLAVSLSALLLPMAAHARTYEVFSTDVPFKFYVGDRTFSPGHYEIIFTGPGLVVLRDSRAHVVATLVTRSIAADAPSASSRLVFRHEKKRPYLSQIWIANRAQFTEILGEELAARTIEPPLPALPTLPMNSFFGYSRQNEPRLKQ